MFSPDTTFRQDTPLIQRLVTFFRDLEPNSSLSISTPGMRSDTPSAQPAVVLDTSQSRRATQYAYIEESSSDSLEGKTTTKSRCKAKKTAVAARAMAPKPIPRVSPKLPRKKALGKLSKVAPKKLTESNTTPENHTDSSPGNEPGSPAVEETAEQRSRHDAALTLLMMSQSSIADEQLTPGGRISDRDVIGDFTPPPTTSSRPPVRLSSQPSSSMLC